MNDYDSLLKICKSRKSLRKFSNKKVNQEDLDKIIEVAFTSPYASGKKNWDILTITDAALKNNIAELVKKECEEKASLINPSMKEYFINYSKSFSFFAGAPVLLIPVFRISTPLSMMLGTSDNEVFLWERDSFVKSIACVSMLILLACESLGLGACYVTGALIAEKEIARLLDLPEGQNIGAIIPVGYALEKNSTNC